MKKICILTYCLIIIILSGCGNSQKFMEKNQIQETILPATPYSSLMPEPSASAETKQSNLYFGVDNDVSYEFQGEAFFDSFGDIPIPKFNTNIKFKKISELKKGSLYHITIEAIPNLDVPKERLNIGYFYVQEDRILRLQGDGDDSWNITSEELDKLINNDIIPSQSKVVCQEEEIKDVLEEEEVGWHQYIVVNKDKREYHSYYQQPHHSGYWESYTWKKGVGLISYKCGFNSGCNYFDLKRAGSHTG